MDHEIPFEFFELSNGMKLVHLQQSSPVSHAGIIIDAGSRHETAREHGIAHFIEHGLFKGTEKRKAFHVISRLEKVGGDLNAYTAREEIFIYASFLKDYTGRTLELFNDILFHSTFPDHEMDKEKMVIIDEINSYKDNPYENIHDQFDEMLYPGHPLGRNILGTKAMVRSFNREHVRGFMSRNFLPERMILCSVGNISGKELFGIASRYLDDGQKREPLAATVSPLEFRNADYRAFTSLLPKRTYQTHAIIGGLAYSYLEEKRQAFSLLINLLGGPGMTSRLNMNIREKFGHCYQIEANYAPFRETGMFSIYAGTDRQYFEKTMELIQKETNRLIREKMGGIQLHQAKQQFIGQMAISLESNLNQMLSMGKSFQVFRKVDNFREMVKKIENVSESDLLAVAGEVLPLQGLSTLAYLSK